MIALYEERALGVIDLDQPITDKLRKRREAELKVIEAANSLCECAVEFGFDPPTLSESFDELGDAIHELEKLEKEK